MRNTMGWHFFSSERRILRKSVIDQFNGKLSNAAYFIRNEAWEIWFRPHLNFAFHATHNIISWGNILFRSRNSLIAIFVSQGLYIYTRTYIYIHTQVQRAKYFFFACSSCKFTFFLIFSVLCCHTNAYCLLKAPDRSCAMIIPPNGKKGTEHPRNCIH